MGTSQLSSNMEDVSEDFLDLPSPVQAVEITASGLPREVQLHITDVFDHRLGEVGLPRTAVQGAIPCRPMSTTLLRAVMDRPRDLSQREQLDDLWVLVNLPEMPPDELPMHLTWMLWRLVDEGGEADYLFHHLYPLFMRWQQEQRREQRTGLCPESCSLCTCWVCTPQHCSQ